VAGSTTVNTEVSRAGGPPGGPNSIVHRPPTRRSQVEVTTQSGASAYSSFCASGSVKASKTVAGSVA
jgi:hypothetical protein